MSEELKPVCCGCGGEPYLKYNDGAYSVMCTKCGIETTGYCDHFDDFRSAKEYATKDWNRAMGEKTAKVINRRYNGTALGVIGLADSSYGLCGNCQGEVLERYTYCSHCGARLEWE